jgi:hypothetical protein
MFFNRLVGVFRLDVQTFAEIEHDRTATGQAALVVALVGLLAGLAGGFASILGTPSFFEVFFSTIAWAFIGWFIWSGITFVVGTSLFGGKATMGEMLRVIGFATAPLMLVIIPCLGGIIGSLWTAVAVFVAIRQGLDLDTGRALFTAFIGFVIYYMGHFTIYIIFFVLRSALGF